MNVEFCSVSGCRQQAFGRCEHCGQTGCKYHDLTDVPEFDFAKITVAHAERVVGWYSKKGGTSSGRPYEAGDRDEREYATHKAFYTQVLSHLDPLPAVKASPRLCLGCLEEFRLDIQKTILKPLLSSIDQCRRYGELCTLSSGLVCLRDSTVRCSKCGESRCQYHAARCRKCKLMFLLQFPRLYFQ